MSDPNISVIIGGAGTGKTTHLLGIMDQIIARGMSPYDIGFCSFTRAARQEAAERAAGSLGESAEALERDGWFKTLHGICFQSLGVGKNLLSDNKGSRDWICEALGEAVILEPDEEAVLQSKTPAQRVLSIWDCSRNRLEPLEITHERFAYCDENTPALNLTRSIVEQYERQKWLDGRCDFVDLLGRFSGVRFRWDAAHELDLAPEGDVPVVPVWFFDEAQDQSALSDRVARRLASRARWVYLVGDPFQSVFSFAGSNPKHFQEWPAKRRRVLDQTYRCPGEIQQLGERRLRECSDYWDRKIQPAPHIGMVDFTLYEESGWVQQISPGEDPMTGNPPSWLLIARTNFQAARLAKRLSGQSIPVPWQGTGKMGSPWHAPVRNMATLALKTLQDGSVITDQEWQTITKQLPAKSFVRGTKGKWAKLFPKGEELQNLPGCVEHWGCSEDLAAAIRSGAWMEMVDRASLACKVAAHWGWDAIIDPPVRIGTIHSVKGSEADNVVMLTTTSHQVRRGEESDQETHNEERRIEYVGITRARHRLIVCKERDPANHMGIEMIDVARSREANLAGVPF